MRSLDVLASFVVVAAIAAPLHAQAPRATAEAAVGTAKLKLEYGCPPWSDQRPGQIDRMVKVGATWRLGADQRTTLVIDGGDVAIGDTIVERGGYGLNLRRTAAKEWAFVVFDGSDTDVQPEDAAWEAPATLAEKTDAAPARLVVSFVEEAGKQALVVRFGPIELRGPVTAVETRESQVELGGEPSSARWFVRKADDAPRAGVSWRAGTLGSFFVGDVDCAMDVDLCIDGATATVRLVNCERARRERMKDDVAGLASHPQPLEVKVPLEAAKKPSGRIGAELVRRNGRLVVTVEAGDRAGEVAVDEKQLLSAPAAPAAPAKN